MADYSFITNATADDSALERMVKEVSVMLSTSTDYLAILADLTNKVSIGPLANNYQLNYVSIISIYVCFVSNCLIHQNCHYPFTKMTSKRFTFVAGNASEVYLVGLIETHWGMYFSSIFLLDWCITVNSSSETVPRLAIW